MKSNAFTALIRNGYALFWQGIFSNFYPCKIKDGDNEFLSSEQMFMYGKAILFKDNKIAKKILESKTPKEAKALGRQVRGFDSDIWDKFKEQIMLYAVTEKFKQNKDLHDEIISDKWNGLQFVEASPFDNIWGIGVSIEDALKVGEDKWGQNLLGHTLDKVRADLIKLV